MPEQPGVPENLTPEELLHFVGRVFGMKPGERERRIGELAELLSMGSFLKRRMSGFSKGMVKRAGLAAALFHEPDLLLLDEPTTGVDPISRREFWNILNDLHLSQTTIVVSTPYMDEADRCSKVGLMYQGSLVICDTPKNIRNRVEGEIIELHSNNWNTAHTLVNTLPWVLEIQTYGEALHIFVDSAQKRIPALERN